jgi:hypothetical protein
MIRFSPVFVFDFCRMCGGEWQSAAPFAAALEMIHTEFEIRQMKMYEEEPRLAIRDMNHVIAEWGRLCDEDDKKSEKRDLARAGRR